MFAKRADEVEGELRIVADPPLIVPIEDLIVPGSEWEHSDALIKKLLNSYRRTLGRQHHPSRSSATSTRLTRWWASAVSGPAATSCCCRAASHNDPLFLQVKEAQASVLERFVGKSTYPNHGSAW